MKAKPEDQGPTIATLVRESGCTLDSLPGLMQLPVLGALFRSRDFVNNESELVVIVTPHLVKPVSPDQLQTPADGLQLSGTLWLCGGLIPARRARALA